MTIHTPAFAHLLPAETYQAWRVLPDGTSQPLDVANAATLDEARQSALLACQHKDHFSVLQTGPCGQVEHVFYVKQGKARWITKPGFAHQVHIKPLEVELRFSRAVTAFAPVKTFRWSPGCDVVGIDRDVVEARAAAEWESDRG